ncbi:MAG: hypothetical protein AABY11_02085 [archaeon]
MEKCWICRRTKEEIVNDVAMIENANASRKEELKKHIEFTKAEESDYPHVMYCTVCENILGDFILKEGVLTEDDEEEDGDESASEELS